MGHEKAISSIKFASKIDLKEEAMLPDKIITNSRFCSLLFPQQKIMITSICPCCYFMFIYDNCNAFFLFFSKKSNRYHRKTLSVLIINDNKNKKAIHQQTIPNKKCIIKHTQYFLKQKNKKKLYFQIMII